MKVTSVYLAIAIVCLAQQAASDLGQPFWFYGLFSMSSCDSRYEFSCANALRTERLTREMIKRNERILDVPLPFCSMDVADRPERLLNNILPLIDRDVMNFTGRCIDKSFAQGEYTTKGIVVLSMVTFEQTQLLSALLQPFDIPLFAITYQHIFPRQLVDHPLFVYSYEASFGKDLHKNGINAFRKELNISLVAILNLGVNSTQTNACVGGGGNTGSAFCVYYEMGLKNGCIKEKTIDIDTQMEETLQNILQNPRLSFVVLYGSNYALARFHNRLETVKTRIRDIHKLYFVNYEVLDLRTSFTMDNVGNKTRATTNSSHQNRDIKALLNKDYVNVFYDIPGALAMNNLMYFTHDFKRNFFLPNFIGRVLDYIKKVSTTTTGSLLPSIFNSALLTFTPDTWKNLDAESKNGFYQIIKHNKGMISAQIYFWKETFYVNFVKLKELYKHKEYSPGEALKARPYCNLTRPECGAGTELKHSFFRERGWDTSYGWHCARCPENQYRNATDSVCHPCGKTLISDESRSLCYDPYTEVYPRLSISSTATMLHLIMSMIVLMVVVFVFIMFYKNVNTPLVRASNGPISFLQIATHALLTILVFISFLGKPTPWRCLSRPIVIGTLFTLTTAINLGKSQKVLLIFKAKVMMSKREVTKAQASTIFMVVLALLVDAAVLTVSVIFDRQPIARQVTINTSISYRKELHCNNNDDILIQFGVVFLIVVANVMQGIRTRHVPSHYRESSYVTYSSFTSSVILVGAAAVYATQTSEHAKTVTLWYTALALNFVHFLLVYFYKMYIMLFVPHMNTRQAFEKKRRAKFDRSFQRLSLKALIESPNLRSVRIIN